MPMRVKTKERSMTGNPRRKPRGLQYNAFWSPGRSLAPV